MIEFRLTEQEAERLAHHLSQVLNLKAPPPAGDSYWWPLHRLYERLGPLVGAES